MSNSISYKIRHKESGLFSRGGTNLHNLWNKQGKTWSNIGHLKNHLIQYSRYNKKDNPYIDAEIIEVVIEYEKCPKFDVSIIFDEIKQKREFEAKQASEELRKYREKLERQQLEELKRKYEGA